MPTRARAVRIREAGGPEILEIGEIEIRDPGPGEILVEVAAAGLNRADVLQRKGFYPAPPGVPADVPGLEFAGTVALAGHDSGWQEGARVMGIVGGGGCATHLVVHGREALPVPERLSLTDAAAIPEVFLTAYDALFLQGGLSLGETCLIHAVGSGVGTAAVQLARAAGARPLGTSRTERKLERCRDLGLEDGVVVNEGAFAKAVLEKTGGRGADVVLDTVGAAYLDEDVKALAHGGRIVVVGLLGGAKGSFNLGRLLPKRGRVMGTVLRSRPLEEKATLAQAFRRAVLPGLESGALRPVVDQVAPMDAIGEAHARMERDETFGKIVLLW
jgi:NADPH:quinone reductase